MLRKSTTGLLVLTILLGVAPAHARDNRRKVEEITGAVVAHDLWKWQTSQTSSGNEGSAIVRIDEPGEVQPRYIRVDFRLRDHKYPKEIVQSFKGKKRLRLKLIRTSDLDEPLDEFIIQVADAFSAERKWPIWELAPGAEGEKLPFSEKLPSYSLVKGGIKLINEK